ncbi:cysteine hydrolase family protein [Natronorarus salvus]|uniref:cysteine hydrolase family protein n=1 Tax=Natronorarus salvus TaxID=3117733 RepID=UPI002F2699AE
MSDGSALVLIDVQEGFDDPVWGERNNPDAEDNVGRLLDAWRESGKPVIHLKHDSVEEDSPLRPDRPGNAIRAFAEPREGEPVFAKSVNSGFIGTDLESHLLEEGIEDLVLVGFTTDHCVSTTTRMAENLGFSPTVVADATAAFDRDGYDGTRYSADESHCLALAHLSGEFAEIRETEELI